MGPLFRMSLHLTYDKNDAQMFEDFESDTKNFWLDERTIEQQWTDRIRQNVNRFSTAGIRSNEKVAWYLKT